MNSLCSSKHDLAKLYETIPRWTLRQSVQHSINPSISVEKSQDIHLHFRWNLMFSVSYRKFLHGITEAFCSLLPDESTPHLFPRTITMKKAKPRRELGTPLARCIYRFSERIDFFQKVISHNGLRLAEGWNIVDPERRTLSEKRRSVGNLAVFEKR